MLIIRCEDIGGKGSLRIWRLRENLIGNHIEKIEKTDTIALNLASNKI